MRCIKKQRKKQSDFFLASQPYPLNEFRAPSGSRKRELYAALADCSGRLYLKRMFLLLAPGQFIIRAARHIQRSVKSSKCLSVSPSGLEKHLGWFKVPRQMMRRAFPNQDPGILFLFREGNLVRSRLAAKMGVRQKQNKKTLTVSEAKLWRGYF